MIRLDSARRPPMEMDVVESEARELYVLSRHPSIHDTSFRSEFRSLIIDHLSPFKSVYTFAPTTERLNY